MMMRCETGGRIDPSVLCSHLSRLTLRHDQLLWRGVARVEHSVERVEVHARAHVGRRPEVDDLHPPLGRDKKVVWDRLVGFEAVGRLRKRGVKWEKRLQLRNTQRPSETRPQL
jgi:hypothetical protein